MQPPVNESFSPLLKAQLAHVVDNQSLTTQQMFDVMLDIMQGTASAAQIAALMVALRMKGESVDELEGAVRAMRSLMTPVVLPTSVEAIDIVGTGGDGASIFNVSTASSLVVSAAGVPVAKHGNRSVSSKSGSADLLEAAGVFLNLTPEQVAQSIQDIGLGFMFAVKHHPAMRFAAKPRAELGIRSFFNLLGPMTNPANVTHHLIGSFDAKWLQPMASVLSRLGSQRALLVHSIDGLDELSIAAPSHMVELKNGELNTFMFSPTEVGLNLQAIDCLKVNNAQESLHVLKDALGKRQSLAGKTAADMIALNAGAALYVANKTLTLKQGVALAEDIIHGGKALEKLNVLIEFTQHFNLEATP